MAHEIETKVLDIDADAVLGKLATLGAKKLQGGMLKVSWFRIPGTKEGEDQWFLRIRTNAAGVHEVTWKARSDIIGTARRHKEINFPVQDPEKLADLFEMIGLERYAYQEKDRTSFSYKDWNFDLDRYPGMPAFIEIEGTSEAQVNEGIALLGLQGKRTWAEGERKLIQEIYGLDWYTMKF